jgi:hypothetical protein
VVAVPVRDEDVLERLTTCLDPVDDARGLIDCHRRVDQDSVPLARDQGRGNVLKHLTLAIWRDLRTVEGDRIGDVKLVLHVR